MCCDEPVIGLIKCIISIIIIDDYHILLNMYIAEWRNDWHDSKSLSRQIVQNSFTCNKGY